MQRLVSIITPTFNSKKTIRRNIDSILSQTYRPLEHIFIDNKSEDGTLELIESLKIEYKNQSIGLKVISEKDAGIYDAMNKGIKNASGEIIGILNSDDFYEPDVIARVVKHFLDDSSLGIVHGMMRLLDGNIEKSVYRENYDYYLLDRLKGAGGAQHSTVFVKKSVYQTIGAFDTKYRLLSDYDFLIRAKKNGIIFGAIDQIVSNFSIGGACDSASQKTKLKERLSIQLKNGLVTEVQVKKDYLFFLAQELLSKKIAKNFFSFIKLENFICR